MKKLILLVMVLTMTCWAVPKPMESIENYNVMMVHGAYGSDKGIPDDLCVNAPEAKLDTAFLNSGEDGANIGYYNATGRLTYWLDSLVFEDYVYDDSTGNPVVDKAHLNSSPYIYSWRAFTNPANSSINNAKELGDRTWKGCGKRRALVEEAQEMKARFVVDEKDPNSDLYGQVALDSMRNHPDLYRQLASRYILIGHSMGGIASREWIQNSDYYHGDVDKVITLDSPHEGTGALNAQLRLSDPYVIAQMSDNALAYGGVAFGLAALPMVPGPSKAILYTYAALSSLLLIAPPFVEYGLEKGTMLENYKPDDPLVDYLDPSKSGKGHVDVLKSIAPHDSLPMFRLLGGTNSMTFTDVNEDYPADVLGWLIPNAYVTSFGNLYHHWGMDKVSFSNAMTGAIVGLGGNLAVWDDGTALVSVSSGMAENTDALISPLVDVKRAQFLAAKNVKEQDDWVVPVMGIVDGVAVVCIAFGAVTVWNETMRIAGEIAIATGGLAALGAYATSAIWSGGFSDLGDSHMMPLYKKNQETWYADYSKTVTPIKDESINDTTITPYLMEDFLYEKPFVNLALSDSRTMDSLSKMGESARESSTLNRNCFYGADVSDTAQFCEIGLYDGNGASFRKRNYAEFRNSPLKFHSSSDWSSIGMKMDRWEKVDGLTPDGDLAPKSVPIRHVERYNVPAITVDNWIEKYSFVVDDLMPHRLRQIRMNFNYQEEIAWECDVTKDPDAKDACTLYRELPNGGGWKSKGKVPHPVKKNGVFEFEPVGSGVFSDLSEVQKDNQNTIAVTTVNKIGLSNTQWMYYLFKATPNYYVDIWPKRGVTLTQVKNFSAYASALNYQGFTVVSARDSIFQGSTAITDSSRVMNLRFVGNADSSEAQFTSDIVYARGVLPEGRYTWQYNIKINDGSASDSSDYAFVDFYIDTTAPRFDITLDKPTCNPDSANFLARYKNLDKESDIRLMRLRLNRVNADGTLSDIAELTPLKDVMTEEFAIGYGDKNKKNLTDGKYALLVDAIDHAVPSRLAYDAVNTLAGKISDKTITASDWDVLKNYVLNRTSVRKEFFIDKTEPRVSDVLVYADTGRRDTVFPAQESYDSLKWNRKAGKHVYLNGDELLNVTYKVTESLAGRDNEAVLVGFNFRHVSDTGLVDRVGDSIWVRNDSNAKNDVALGVWKESAGMLLGDGDYAVSVIAKDEAGNIGSFVYGDTLRVDRTAPNISGLITNELAYTDLAVAKTADFTVDENNDVEINKKGMQCHYRIVGGPISKWNLIKSNGREILKDEKVHFAIDESQVDTISGKRYLEVACVDFAGNVQIATTLFHVGPRAPVITSPTEVIMDNASTKIVIAGKAPSSLETTGETGVYRLLYREKGTSNWRSEGIETVISNRSMDSANISRTLQSENAVLGYLSRSFVSDTSEYEILLSAKDCETCEWRSDTSSFYVFGDTAEVAKMVLEANKNSFKVEKDSVQISLILEDSPSSEYELKVYIEDENKNSLVEYAQNIRRNPFMGTPADTNKNQGVWFYYSDTTWHLKWKGLRDSSEIFVDYISSGFSVKCVSSCDTTIGESPLKSLENTLLSAAYSNVNGYPEFIKPFDVDRRISFKGKSGEVHISARDAFSVSSDITDSLTWKSPVYFGNYATEGFVFYAMPSDVKPLMTGWTADPKNYGLRYVWNGTKVGGEYPSGNVKVYAVATEKTFANPQVIMDSLILNLELPPLELTLDSVLPDFEIIRNNNGDDSTYALGDMVIPFGIKYYEANVDASVYCDGAKVATLTTSNPYKPFSANSGYRLHWNGTNDKGFPQKVDGVSCYVEVVATATDTTQKSVSKTAAFGVKLFDGKRDMTPAPGDTVSPQLMISEAVDDVITPGRHRYEPVADYLVTADVSGWYLPQALRDSVSIDYKASGTQKALMFQPERFSLALKRQRDSLGLVILVVVVPSLDKLPDCDDSDREYDANSEKYKIFKTIRHTFTKNNSSLSDSINAYIGSIGNGRVVSEKKNSVVEVYAFSPKDVGMKIDSALYEMREKAVFHHIDNLPASTRAHTYEHDTLSLNVNPNLGCSNSDNPGKENSSEDDCTYADTTKGYDPNANLFVINLMPKIKAKEGELSVGSSWHSRIGSTPILKTYEEYCADKWDYCNQVGYLDTLYFSELGQIRNGDCYNNKKGYERYEFKFTLNIPSEYWNAPFGMDNLVNRTIRFDPKNISLFGENAGYLNVLDRMDALGCTDSICAKNFFDGEKWSLNKTYGYVTPFEMQHLRFFSADKLPGGANTFLFADEDARYKHSSRYIAKFYGPRNVSQSYYEAKIVGEPHESWNDCENESVAMLKNSSTKRCQITLNSNMDSVVTPLFNHGNLDIYVALNKNVEEITDSLNLAYPLDTSWSKNFRACANDSCKKAYLAGSRAHYYYNDYAGNKWNEVFVQNHMIRNPMDSVDYHNPNDFALLGIDAKKMNDSTVSKVVSAASSSNYKNNMFYVPLKSMIVSDSILPDVNVNPRPNLAPLNNVYKSISHISGNGDTAVVKNDTLYLPALKWNQETVYRRTLQKNGGGKLPTPTDTVVHSLLDLYRYQMRLNCSVPGDSCLYFANSNSNGWRANPWIKEQKVNSAKVLQLDSSVHSHFKIAGIDSASVGLVYHKLDSASDRPAELVELRGKLRRNEHYTISYLHRGVFEHLVDTTITGASSSNKTYNERLAWFNMNRLQGNTTFMMMWGGGAGIDSLYFNRYDLVVGKNVSGADKIVKSIMGELEVSFPDYIDADTMDVTVRTADSKDYNLRVYNDMQITGPIMEIFPSTLFDTTKALPRVQMKVSRLEMEARGVTPNTLRLYKVDTAQGLIIPLTNTLYGFLKADGSSAVNGADTTCSVASECDPGYGNWDYILISAETKTFSVFVALDSVRAEMPSYTVEVLPGIATTDVRKLRVEGLEYFDVYVDDDVVWNDSADATPATKQSGERDSNGLVSLALLNRDTTYIFVLPRVNDSTGSFVSPRVARAIKVPAEFACFVEGDSLWLGLDNGYLRYDVACSHPGHGLMTLLQNGKSVIEINTASNDTIYYDGRKGFGKIPDGVYESRYVGVSVLGSQLQVAGPMVYTDSARPMINSWHVDDSSDVIARVFKIDANIFDEKSGVAFAIITAVLGNDTIAEKNIVPDSIGNIQTSIRLNRKKLADCAGCHLSINMHAQDFGHNHVDTLWRSGKLFPYPTELALWYPAHEGSGKLAYEFTGTDHHLNLFMFKPWLSGSGLYFYHPADSAVGVGHVDLGTSSEYTLEARINPGNAQDTLWRRVMGFEGTSGLKIELQNQGGNLRLVEGNKKWTLRGDLPSNAWSHVVVAVDSAEVCFYIDGILVHCDASTAQDREFYGTFSMGERVAQNFVGNVSDIRLYTKALNGDEVLALTQPIKDERDTSEIHTIIVLGNEMEGADRQFSCAVSGNGYFVGDGKELKMSAYIPASAEYRAFVYVRSARESGSAVKIGVEGSAVYSGSVKLENTWRPVEIAGVKLPLNSGMQKLIVDVPEGVQIAGIALTNGDMVEASQISWKSDRENAGGKLAAKSKVKSSVRFEGYPEDKTMLRPRIRLVNVSDEAVNGFKVRYYFRGEAPEMVHADGYLPQKDTAGLTVNGESVNTGYVEWSLDTTQILPGRSPYFGEGPLMGIYNEGYAPWYAEDDPSYVLPGSAATDADGFISDFGVVVLDADNNLIGGSCVEMEDPIEVLPPSVRVVAADVRDDQLRGSEIALKVENLGNMALRNYDVRYYFQVEEGIKPALDVYNWTTFVDGANMEFLGDGRYQVNIHVGNKPLTPHNVWPDEFKFALHENNWEPLWNTSDDPSHNGLSKSYAVTANICVYDSTGKKIYGEDPVWKEPKYVAKSGNEDSLVVDNGYDSGVYVPVIRTPEGLLVELDGYPYVQLDLVYANGVPIRNIFTGTVIPGGQFIAVDWNGIDLKHTYLVLRKNSQIVSTKLLSNL